MRNGETILATVHGSYLYGLATPDSDVDLFRVVYGPGKTKQRTEGGFDVVTVPLDHFLTNVFNGSHQSCEALFSPTKYVHPNYEPFLAAIRVTGEDAFARYRRTIRAFSYGTPKQRRHSMRLGYNLKSLREEGRFNPVMTDGQITMATAISELYWGASLTDIAINL